MMTRELKAGNLNILYENGFLRYIRLGETEVLRMIYYAVRDKNWGSVPKLILNEKIQEYSNSFEINYVASFNKGNIDFFVNCQIIGTAENQITFNFNGKALTSFEKNRIGLLVHHPISSCKGAPVTITHTNGTRSQTNFPLNISSAQPFMEIRNMSWEPLKGCPAKLSFEGDIFETEDQRNWTDASFKTYSTPLADPFPVLVGAGELVAQKITFEVEVPMGFDQKLNSGTCKITVDNTVPFPKIGTELKNVPSTQLLDQLKISGLSFVRVALEIDKDISHTLNILNRIKTLNIDFELAIFTDDADFVDKLTSIRESLSMVRTILLLPDQQKTTLDNVIQQAPRLRELFENVTFFGGTDAFFTELNRQPISTADFDGISYSINPQVHAFDDASLVETLEAQSYTVNSARRLFPKKRIRISPITFRMRWNPNSTDATIPFRQPLNQEDPRQYSFFGACWWLISLKYLAESEIDGVTYFQLEGENGLVREKNGTRNVLDFSPIFKLMQEVSVFKEARIRVSSSSRPLSLNTIVFESKDKSVCMAVNWTNEIITAFFPQGFRPIKYCQGFDSVKGIFDWKPWTDSVNSGTRLPKNSLTVLEMIN